MEAREHSKNGASLKSPMSRGNIMRRVYLFFAALGVSIASTFAQDVITLKNGTDINALVQEIGDVEVLYKKFDNPNGPNYTLKKSEILMIRYVNGSKDIFSEEEKTIEKQDVSTSKLDSVKNNYNSSTTASFILKKNDIIAIKVYGLKLATRNMRKSLERKLGELGFCCVYTNAKEVKNDTISRIDIVVSPDGVLFRFRIFDLSLQKGEVFAESYHWSTMFTLDKVVDNFIRDITPFIEK